MRCVISDAIEKVFVSFFYYLGYRRFVSGVQVLPTAVTQKTFKTLPVRCSGETLRGARGIRKFCYNHCTKCKFNNKKKEQATITYMCSADVNFNCLTWLVELECQSTIASCKNQLTGLTNHCPADCSDTKTTLEPHHCQLGCHGRHRTVLNWNSQHIPSTLHVLLAPTDSENIVTSGTQYYITVKCHISQIASLYL